MPEISRRVRITKNLTFLIDERVFSKFENRFGMITVRNILGLNFSRWMATEPFVCRFSVFDSTRRSQTKAF